MNVYQILDGCIPHPYDGTCYHHCLMNNIYETTVINKCRHTPENGVEIVDDFLWDGVSNELFNQIRDMKPTRLRQPILEKRPLVYSKIFNLRQIVEEIVDSAGGDCYGVYVRDADSLETKEIIYDYQVEATHRYRKMIYDSVPENDENMVQYLLSLLTINDELVLVLGNIVHDDYIRKLNDNQYLFMVADKYP